MWLRLRETLVIPLIVTTMGGAMAPGSAVAQSPSPPVLPDSLLDATLNAIPGDALTLETALELGEANATSLGEARANLEAARGAVGKEKGVFDPELFAEVTRSGEDTPTSSVFAGAPVLKTDQTAVRGGARITLPVGTELEASLNTTRTTTNSEFATLDPEFDTSGRLSLRQPLLSGFGPQAHQDLSAAEKALLAARARYDDARLGLASQVEGAYWDVYAAERDYAVRLLIRDQARALVTDAQTRARAGLVGPDQVANARTFLAEQELAVLDAQEGLDRLSDRLASLIGTRPQGTPRFRPVDRPQAGYPVGNPDSLVAGAVTGNYELQAQEATVAQFEALARGASWGALPDLDLLASIGGNGLSGTGQETMFGTTVYPAPDIHGGFGQTWAQVRDRDFPTWSVGVQLSLPLGLREGRGERARLKGEVAAARQRLTASERALEEQVRQAHREVVHGADRLTAAKNGVDAAQEQVRIGLIEFRNGRTTAFELVRLGADFASAQQRYSQALVGTAKAAARLHYLTSGAYRVPSGDGGSIPR
jgi:outer membrane protein